MNYDPKLRECMAEIEETLKKFECGGFICLSSKTHGEFKMCIETPSWSNVRFIKGDKGIHIKLYTKSDHARTEATVAMLAQFRDMAAMLFKQTDQIMEQIQHHAVVEHVPFGGGINNDDRDEL
jgi:hypothetical protein